MNDRPIDGTLPIEPPLVIAGPEALRWDQRCDLLVAGFGAAGAAAAITAAEADADVRIVDRFGRGGASAISGGVVYAGGGTPQQLKAGYSDTPETMFEYLRLEVGDAVAESTLRRFCEESRDLLAWLESLGASFDSDVPPPKTSYPKDGCYLYFSGNEKVAPFAQAATPAPRGHRTVDAGLSGGRLYSYLRARVEALEIPVTAPCAVHRLITDEAGAVLGAEIRQFEPGSDAARRHARLIRRAEALHNFAGGLADRLRARALALELAQAKPLRVRASRGVLLATGGFIFNARMLAEHAPHYRGHLRLGTTGCDGSGIRLGQSAGGEAARLHKVSAWRFINPPQAWEQGIVVDADGRRFCNEASYGARLGVAMCDEHDGRAWLILDSKLRRTALREALFGGLWSFQKFPALLLMLFAKRARSVAALAGRLAMPIAELEATIERYNAAAAGRGEDAFGKEQKQSRPLLRPPFFALDISAANPLFPCPAITLGGLRVDETSGAVLDREGRSIPGLYAAGRAAVGIASNGYVSGLSLADCLWSGRRAGAAVAANGKRGVPEIGMASGE